MRLFGVLGDMMYRLIKFSLIISFIYSIALSAHDIEINYCDNPTDFVCGQHTSNSNVREKEIALMKEQIKNLASINIEQRLNTLSKNRPANKFRIFSGLKESLIKSKIRFEETSKASASLVSNYEDDIITSDIIFLVKSLLKEAIDNSPIDQVNKTNMKLNIDEVIVGNFSDYLDRTTITNGSGLSLISHLFTSSCGSDGLVDNAFATELGKDKYVLICPGWLITLNKTPTNEERFNNILLVLAHEIAHHIDSRKFPNVYKEMIECYTNNFSKFLNKSDKRKEMCKRNKEKCNHKTVIDHMGEITADYWASEVTALYLTKNNISESLSEKLLSESIAKLCDAKDEGTHPSGLFRINNIQRANPNISNHLECTRQSKFCSIKGLE
jgi:hypothetical protein